LERFLSSIFEARAVRKAVISSALIRARGEPVLSRSVSDPLGEVLWEDATEGGGLNVVVLDVGEELAESDTDNDDIDDAMD
jgi:hypothetical protein